MKQRAPGPTDPARLHAGSRQELSLINPADRNLDRPSGPRAGVRARAFAHRSVGFTLIELLIVLVIIGVLATMVSLSVGGRATEDRMQADSRRVEALLRLASDEAQAKGLEIGFVQTPTGFQFLTLDDKGENWIPIADGSFRPREIAEPFYLELRLEGQLAKPRTVEAPKPVADTEEEKSKFFDNAAATFDNVAGKKAEERLEPQIYLLSTGEISPAFTLDLRLRSQRSYYRIEGTELGRIQSSRGEDRA